jgi:16S rRNA (guanine527-N7)-methyltransferase
VSAAEPVPAVAAEVFGDRLAVATRYADLLCTEGVVRGVIGPHESARIWSRHLLNSAALSALVPIGARVIDVGSGAGLPGVPLALARPDLVVTLVEPLARRVAFLTEVVEALDVDVTVVRARAQELARGEHDVVVARAVAPLDRLARMTVPLLREGGVLLAVKGESAADELAGAAGALRDSGVVTAEVVVVTAAGGPVTVIRCVAGAQSLPSARRSRRRAQQGV